MASVVGSTLCQNRWNFHACKLLDQSCSRCQLISCLGVMMHREVYLGHFNLLRRLRGITRALLLEDFDQIYRLVACIGGLLTILALGFDTFAQQQVLTVE